MGLRLVVYDATGHGRSWFQPLLTASWRVGSGLYRHYPHDTRVDAIYGATSWTDAVAWLASVEPTQAVSEIQYWGHGLPGRVFIAGEAVTSSSFTQGPLAEDWRAVAARLTRTSLVWFRTCGAFGGPAGHEFATTTARFFDCRVAGHTFVIGPVQSGLHSLGAGATPGWSVDEGQGTAGELLGSLPWSPHTISFLNGAIPKGW